MRFLHLSDTHLGYHQYGLVERAKDYFDVFLDAVDKAIDYKVDFIIHTGDFFHTHRPSNETLLQGIEIIKRLKDHNIPIFTIAGNHDRGSGVRDKSALEVLSHLGLKVLESSVDDSLGVNVFGIKYVSPLFIKKLLNLNEIFENLYEKAQNKNNFNILMLHLEFEPFFQSGLKLEQQLKEGMFDYIGIGHYHQRQEPLNINDTTVVYSGSTEYTQFNEKQYVEKGCYLVEVDGKKCKTNFIPLKTREFLSFSFDDETFPQTLESLKNLDFGSFVKSPILSLKGTTKNFLTKKDVLLRLEKENLINKFLYINCEVVNHSKTVLDFQILDDVNNSTTIKEKLKELLDEEDLINRLESVIEKTKGFDDLKELEQFIESHEDLFKL
ncbi:exonuclease SbcCD subunit D [Sulfurihydrogenibium sp.]|uniref:metallophosphoesterase family protein n=1 Tax=Sulfurihydrogenibium sp. TaxID=2053621 RepID=UPI002609BCC8|nr:exonuclease SbcCD subunit D [Sulfurihydrogenibium sp.]